MSKKECNQCDVGVSDLSHKRHWRILQALANADVPGGDDLFVHQLGDPAVNFDEEGLVVICDQCFIMELADNLLLAPLQE